MCLAITLSHWVPHLTPTLPDYAGQRSFAFMNHLSGHSFVFTFFWAKSFPVQDKQLCIQLVRNVFLLMGYGKPYRLILAWSHYKQCLLMVPLWVRPYAICGTGLWCHIMCCAFLGGQICKSWIWVELSTPAQGINLPFKVVFFSCCYNEFCVGNVRTNRVTCQDRQHGEMEPV